MHPQDRRRQVLELDRMLQRARVQDQVLSHLGVMLDRAQDVVVVLVPADREEAYACHYEGFFICISSTFERSACLQGTDNFLAFINTPGICGMSRERSMISISRKML